jgi:hypothetical protein
MPLNRSNMRPFFRKLYAGLTLTVTLLRRGDDLRQGVVTKYTLFNCFRGPIHVANETIQRDMSADVRAAWTIPRQELERVGVWYLNNLDRIIDYDSPQKLPRWWQPEAPTGIDVKLREDVITLACLRVDPPAGANLYP